MNVPRLAKGQGWKGPEFYGCFNTGTAPSIFRANLSGKYVVGPEHNCRAAMSNGACFGRKRVYGKGRERVWIFKTRAPAVAKFKTLAEAQEAQNAEMRRQHAEAARKAAAGDVAAALALGDF